MAGFIDFVEFIFSGGMLIYTIPLLLMLAYWLIFVFGMVDLDWLDAGGGAVDGAAEGVVEGAAEAVVESAAEGVAEAAAEGVAEGVAEAAAEGVAEGVAEGAAESLSEGAAAHLHHGLSHASEVLTGGVMAGEVAGSGMAHAVGRGAATPLVSRLFSFLNVGHVPTTIVGSIFIIAFWLTGFFGLVWFPASRWPSAPFWFVWLVRLVITTAVSYVVAGLAARPLRHVFGAVTVHAHHHLIGQACVVRSSRVDREFGEGDLTVNGSFLTISLRTMSGETLQKGDTAQITGYDENQDAYYVRLCR